MNNQFLSQIEKDLNAKREQLVLRLNSLAKDKSKVSGPLSMDFEDQAVELENYEVVDGLESMELKELQQINSALKRIAVKSYGKCTACGENISDNRLKAFPTALTCLSCSK
jgi:DnaK suppressor protein